jgi:hypothetical protein
LRRGAGSDGDTGGELEESVGDCSFTFTITFTKWPSERFEAGGWIGDGDPEAVTVEGGKWKGFVNVKVNVNGGLQLRS